MGKKGEAQIWEKKLIQYVRTVSISFCHWTLKKKLSGEKKLDCTCSILPHLHHADLLDRAGGRWKLLRVCFEAVFLCVLRLFFVVLCFEIESQRTTQLQALLCISTENDIQWGLETTTRNEEV